MRRWVPKSDISDEKRECELNTEPETEDRTRYRLDETLEPSAQHDERILHAFRQAGDEIAMRRRRRTLRWLAIPAAVAAGLIVVPFLLPDPDVPLRSGADAVTVAPANASVLSRIPERLQWTLQPDARSYRVVLYGLDNEPVYAAEIAHPASEVRLPPNTVSALRDGETYYWLVEVKGAVSSELGPYWFSIDTAAEDRVR